MNIHAEKYVKCPYFIHVYDKKIVCEGFNDNSRIFTKYDTNESRDECMDFYCKRYPNGCPIAQANDDLYSDPRKR